MKPSRTTEWRHRTGRSSSRRRQGFPDQAEDLAQAVLREAGYMVRSHRISLGEAGVDPLDAQQEAAIAALKVADREDFAAKKYRNRIYANRIADLLKLQRNRNNK